MESLNLDIDLDLNLSLEEPTPIPGALDAVEYTGNAEEDAKRELEALHGEFAAIHADRKRIKDKLTLIQDSEYWCCLCFQSREQVEAFQAAMGWKLEKYLDGPQIAKRLKIPLPEVKLPKIPGIDKRLVKMAHEV